MTGVNSRIWLCAEDSSTINIILVLLLFIIIIMAGDTS